MAKIVWNEGLELLEWWELDADGDWPVGGPLRGQSLVREEPEARRVRREEGLCPTCGRAAPRERSDTANGHPRRPAKTWALHVPDDHEVGADVLDVYVEDLAVLMGLNPESQRLLRYHVLVPVLEWVMQQRTAFIADWEEAAG